MNELSIYLIGKPAASLRRIEPSIISDDLEDELIADPRLNKNNQIFMINETLRTQFAAVIVGLMYCIIAIYIVVYLSMHSRQSTSLKFGHNTTDNFNYGCIILLLSTVSSISRPMFGQISACCVLFNTAYWYRICKRGKFKMEFIGKGTPPQELTMVIQLCVNLTVLAILDVSWGGLLAICACLLALADLKIYRLRFTQGSCDLSENWKPCPLIDKTGERRVVSDQPSSMFTLSYRWQNENSAGFSDSNVQMLLKQLNKYEANVGFVDRLCVWNDGQMATLDVNKTVYSVADKHFIFANSSHLKKLQNRLTSESLVFFSLEFTVITILFVRINFTWRLLIIILSAILAGFNHLNNYISFWMKTVLPDIKRVWLRLEYECRRGHLENSLLLDQNGVFAEVSFTSKWYDFLAAYMWLCFHYGNPICQLPSEKDFTGLESRSWSETITLIDEWTNYSLKINYETQKLRKKENSQVLTRNVANYKFPSSPEVHLVGGEIIYWWFGSLHKSDGVISKHTFTKGFCTKTTWNMWFNIDKLKIA